MAELYLITGFLGAGKTTFLHQFARLFPDKRTAIVINEFGRKGVDGALLRDLDVGLTEINNGSIFCSCKIEQFDEAIRKILAERAPDLIFVEASGLSDPTAVRHIFADGAYPELHFAGTICLVDAVRFHKTYETAKVCRMQLAISDLVIVNKTDLATREEIDGILSIARAQKPDRPVHETSFGRVEPAWLEEMERPAPAGGPAEIHTRDITLQKLNLRVSGFDRASLEAFLKMFADDTYRVKGFVQLPEGMFLADCVGPLVSLRPYEGPDEEPGNLTVLYGNGLPARKSIKSAAAWFRNCTVEIE